MLTLLILYQSAEAEVWCWKDIPNARNYTERLPAADLRVKCVSEWVCEIS